MWLCENISIPTKFLFIFYYYNEGGTYVTCVQFIYIHAEIHIDIVPEHKTFKNVDMIYSNVS